MMQPQAKERQKPSETESDKERILQEHVPLTLISSKSYDFRFLASETRVESHLFCGILLQWL